MIMNGFVINGKKGKSDGCLVHIRRIKLYFEC